MENNLNPWNDRLEIEGDIREELAGGYAEFVADEEAHYQEEKALFQGDGSSFEENLRTPEEKAEYEAWLDAGLPKGWENAPLSAQIAFLVAGDNPEEFDSVKAYLKGE